MGAVVIEFYWLVVPFFSKQTTCFKSKHTNKQNKSQLAKAFNGITMAMA